MHRQEILFEDCLKLRPMPKKYQQTLDQTDMQRYQCIYDYVKTVLQMSKFGLIRPLREEKDGEYVANIMIVSPEVELDEDTIAKLNDQATDELLKVERRKKFAIVHCKEKIFILGGYIYDASLKQRSEPTKEWVFDIKKEILVPIEKLPQSRANFGIATDGNKIAIFGGQTFRNEPLRSCFFYDLNTKKWSEIEPLPAPTSGPGLCLANEDVHVVGGYDIIGGQADLLGEYLVYHMKTKKWEIRKSITPKRTRPLVVMINEKNIKPGLYCIGGTYMDNKEYKVKAVPQIMRYALEYDTWEPITEIPDLSAKHGLGYTDGMVMVSEKVIDYETNRILNVNVLHTYDIEHDEWHDGEFKRKRNTQSKSFQSPVYTTDTNPTADSLEKTLGKTTLSEDSSKSSEKVHRVKGKDSKKKRRNKKKNESSSSCCMSLHSSQRSKKHHKHKHRRRNRRNKDAKKKQDQHMEKGQNSPTPKSDKSQNPNETATSTNYFRKLKNHAFLKHASSGNTSAFQSSNIATLPDDHIYSVKVHRRSN